MPEVHIRHLTKSFGATRVLDDVTFAAASGELVTLLGPSGCGKTTTLMSIAGLETPDRGTITCGEVTFFDADAKIQSSPSSASIAVTSLSHTIFPQITFA